MTVDDLNTEMARANAEVDHCLDCGMKCIVRYVPGCTYIFCLGCKESKRSLPDWNVSRIVEEWND